MSERDSQNDDYWKVQTEIPVLEVEETWGESPTEGAKPYQFEWNSDDTLPPIEGAYFGEITVESPFGEGEMGYPYFDGSLVSDTLIPTEVKLPEETPEEIIKSYGIKVEFPKDHKFRFPLFISKKSKEQNPNYTIDYVQLDEPTQSYIIKYLARCLIFYPRNFFRENGIRKFHIAKLSGAKGFFHIKTGNIFLSPDSLTGSNGKVTTFHHEVNHFLEKQTPEGKNFVRKWEKKFPRITLMKRLLAKLTGKAISENAQVYKGRQFHKLSPDLLNTMHFRTYGAHSPSENRAVTFEQIFGNPDAIKYLSYLPRIKKEKLEFAMSLLHDLDHRFDKNFWADYVEGMVDSNYWRTRNF